MIDFSNQSAIDWLKVGALLLDILKDQLCWILPQYVSSHLISIVVYCKKGKRASLSKKIIQKLGYPNVIAWGGVDELPLKELFTTNLPICICQTFVKSFIFGQRLKSLGIPRFWEFNLKRYSLSTLLVTRGGNSPRNHYHRLTLAQLIQLLREVTKK